jgi:MinD superfamily P-loop ATPase
MKELVVISGKGGCGKTSVTASLAALAQRSVLVDCDVDAPDLHILLQPEIRQRTRFQSGFQAVVDPDLCTGCGQCEELCRFSGIRLVDGKPVVSPVHCEGCGLCVDLCPHEALTLVDADCGEWYVSDTHYGPMVHARLTPGRPNSGRLVSLVRSEAKKLAERQELDLILVDGPPGIGCPVIASVGGVDVALVVTEPTPSGKHDLLRALELLRHFGVPAWFCVNRADIHPEGAAEIRTAAEALGARHAGDIRYDQNVTACQYDRKPVVACADSPAANDIRSLWNTLKKEL